MKDDQDKYKRKWCKGKKKIRMYLIQLVWKKSWHKLDEESPQTTNIVWNPREAKSKTECSQEIRDQSEISKEFSEIVFFI